MGGRLRRFAAACIAASCLSFAGCVNLPYCLPEIECVGPVQVPRPSDDVHIFRVDGTEYLHLPHGLNSAPPSLIESHELAQLQPSDRRMLPSQWSVGVEHGWFSIGLQNQRFLANKHSVAVRFYRVGYETINVGPGDVSKDPVWKAVADLAGQEKAVDDLIGANSRFFDKDTGYYGTGYRGPAAGKSFAAHREALLFCANEYDRIAFFVTDAEPDAEATRTWLADKAARLRALADGK